MHHAGVYNRASQWADMCSNTLQRLTTATLQGQHEAADEACIASKTLHSRAVRPCFIPFINRLTITQTCSACAWGRTPVGHAERSTDVRCLVYRCMHDMPVLACGVRPATPQWYTASRLQMASCRAGRNLLLSSLAFEQSACRCRQLPACAGLRSSACELLPAAARAAAAGGPLQLRPAHSTSMGQAQWELVWRIMGTARGRSMSRCSDTTREMSCRMSASLRPIIALSRLPSNTRSTCQPVNR